MTRMATTRTAGTWIAIAMLAIAPGCSDDDDAPAGVCRPTPQTVANPAGAIAFCESLFEIFCHRAFTDCAGQLGSTGFSSEAECVAGITSLCAYGYSTSWYDAPCGESCLAYAAGASCAALEADEPQACAAATGEAGQPPPTGVPACSATIPAGTIADAVTVSDPLFDGGYGIAGHARAYCINLTAGQIITIRTDPPVSGTGIYDSVVHLYDPSATSLGYNDDGGDALYSLLTRTIATTGQHRIVVRGFDSSDVGGYRLTVTVY